MAGVEVKTTNTPAPEIRAGMRIFLKTRTESRVKCMRNINIGTFIVRLIVIGLYLKTKQRSDGQIINRNQVAVLTLL